MVIDISIQVVCRYVVPKDVPFVFSKHQTSTAHEQRSTLRSINIQPAGDQSNTALVATEENLAFSVADPWVSQAHSTVSLPCVSSATSPSSSCAKSIDKGRLGLFQFDDSVLQTINEWQRRNAAFLPTQSEVIWSDTTASSLQQISSQSPRGRQKNATVHSPRTLLALSQQQATSEKVAIYYSIWLCMSVKIVVFHLLT